MPRELNVPGKLPGKLRLLGVLFCVIHVTFLAVGPTTPLLDTLKQVARRANTTISNQRDLEAPKAELELHSEEAQRRVTSTVKTKDIQPLYTYSENKTIVSPASPNQDPKKRMSSSLPPGTPRRAYSTVFYKACCGLGHRLIRMSSAYHVAKLLAYKLQPNWGYCEESKTRKVGIFSHLFQRETDLAYINSTGQNLFFANEVPGFLAAFHASRHRLCGFSEAKMNTDFDFYTSLRDRFRERSKIDGFVEKHFAGKTVLGIHIRAGNGETGHFQRHHRGIHGSPRDWVSNVTSGIRDLVSPTSPPPVLYVASDTHQYIEFFRSALHGVMPVVDWKQERPKDGDGVFFGEYKPANAAVVSTDASKCLQRWKDALYDMLLLSHADVLIAGQSSSFTQSLPLSIVFGRKDKRKVDTAFCEVIRGSVGKLRCYESYIKWACDEKSHTIRYDMLQMFPAEESEDWKSYFHKHKSA